jgi:LysM repeat protein
MPAQRSGGKSYTIQKGDTLWDISKRTGISVPDLAVMNNIRDPSRIMPGQEITLGGTLARTGQQTTAPARKVAPLPGRRTVTPLPIARTSPAVSPGSGVTVNGIDLAFMPASVQRRYQE